MEKSNEMSNPEKNGPPAANQVQVGTSQQVDRALIETNSAHANNKRWLVPTLIVLVVIVISVAGYFTWQYFKAPKLNLESLENTEYLFGEGKLIRLDNGQYEGQTEDQDKYIVSIYDNDIYNNKKVAFGDLDGDGEEDPR